MKRVIDLEMICWLMVTVLAFFGCQTVDESANLILRNGNIATLDNQNRTATAVAIKDGLLIAVGSDDDVLKYADSETEIIDVNGRTVIPGLNDSHSHVIRAGLNYNMELRWDGVPSLKRALQMLKEQAKRTPEGQWVRVVGGWSEQQFEEKRLPTLKELNDAAPNTPVFVMYLYSLGFMNQAALEALAYDKDTYYPGGVVELDKAGNPTGSLIAKPSALLLYSTLVKAPKLSPEDQLNSTLHYFRELNRLGLTSSIDAGGGGQFFPDNYEVAKKLAQKGKLTVRIAYYLFAQEKGKEFASYQKWTSMVKPGQNDDMLHVNGYTMHGAGENLTWAAADFENFLEPRPELGMNMEAELRPTVKLLVKNRWPFRIHATYNESITRFLDLFEEINKEMPFDGLRWIIDHAETISVKNMARVKALGGGIAVQNRMFFQGEHFIERYGAKVTTQTPPVEKMLKMGLPVGLGTDGTRVSSYNPWLSLYWIVSGKTWGGTILYPEVNRLDRTTALRLMTAGSAWFSGDEDVKGTIETGKFADLVVLSADYFSIPEDEIKELESVLTIVAGKPVYGAQEFSKYSPELPSISPDWSPVAQFGGYYNGASKTMSTQRTTQSQ